MPPPKFSLLKAAQDLLGARFDAAVGLVSVVIFLIAWELVATYRLVDPLYSSSPSRIGAAFVAAAQSQSFVRDITTSAYEFGLGYLLAVCVGIPLGIAVGWYRMVRAVVTPFATILYVTPYIALTSLIIIWFGIGLWSKVVIVLWAGLFPILIATESGVRAVSSAYLDLARGFAARDMQIFRTVVLPACIPNIVAGMRLSLGRSLVAVIFAEMFSSVAGIGNMIANAGANFQTDQVFVGVAVIAAAAIVMDAGLQMMQRRVAWWSGS
jgi:NitT/TauT family transport system permease protein